jgi:uncharacterized protein YdhG (YjbR/CyaY superfamily)
LFRSAQGDTDVGAPRWVLAEALQLPLARGQGRSPEGNAPDMEIFMGGLSLAEGVGMAAPTSVEDYLAALPEAQRAALEALRRTIKAAAPEATETISYGMPAFKLHGRFLVWYAAFTAHCSLYPASTKVLEAHGEALKPYFSGKGTIRFTADKPLPSALVKKIVKTRIEENAALSRR